MEMDGDNSIKLQITTNKQKNKQIEIDYTYVYRFYNLQPESIFFAPRVEFHCFISIKPEKPFVNMKSKIVTIFSLLLFFKLFFYLGFICK